jgi:TrmH family RNA methyltransferase
VIRSRDNATFKGLKKLSRSARERRRLGRAVIEGERLVEACLREGGEPERVVLSAGAEGREGGERVLRLAPKAAVTVLDNALFRELSTLSSPDGILAVVGIPRREWRREEGDVLFLDRLQDPGNLGTVLRSAAASGLETVSVSSGSVDPWSPKVLRGGMGAHFFLEIREEQDLAAAVEDFDGQVLVLDSLGTTSVFESDLRKRTAFVLGGEGAGVSPEVAKTADRVVAIPMPGWSEPLNAAVAASICLFELVRQRR